MLQILNVCNSESVDLWLILRKLFDFAATLDTNLALLTLEVEFQETIQDVKIIAEPRRYFVDTAFTLAAQVILKKETEDGQMFYYLNESIYNICHSSYRSFIRKI